ncbi:hypothetical protein [Rubritalea tangerina]
MSNVTSVSRNASGGGCQNVVYGCSAFKLGEMVYLGRGDYGF